MRRRIEPGEKLLISRGAGHKNPTFEQGLFRGAARRFKHEIGARLAQRRCRPIDEASILGLNPDVERIARRELFA